MKNLRIGLLGTLILLVAVVSANAASGTFDYTVTNNYKLKNQPACKDIITYKEYVVEPKNGSGSFDRLYVHAKSSVHGNPDIVIKMYLNDYKGKGIYEVYGGSQSKNSIMVFFGWSFIHKAKKENPGTVEITSDD